MQTDNRLFDDFARLAGGALNALTGLKTEIENLVRQQFEGFLAGMNMVTREEFEAVQGMVAKARDEQEALLSRLAAVEAELSQMKGGSAAAAAAPAAKPAVRRPRKPKQAEAVEKP